MKKKIFIHAGPGKTGTSAVQKWMLENIDLLKRHKILYPEHKVDSNGVSSGNLEHIFDHSKHSTKINILKIKALIEKFENSDYKILLLSSEFFFLPLIEISNNIPEAVFILYLRNGADLIESSYNQGIKRHGFTHKFDTKPNTNQGQIRKILEYSRILGEKRLILKPYDDEYFKTTNITKDILRTIDKKIIAPQNITNEKINKSYTLEALELKRYTNRYIKGNLDLKLDKLLQQGFGQTTNYTFLPAETRHQITTNFIESLYQINNHCKIENLERFVKNIKSKKLKKEIKQEDNYTLESAIKDLYHKNLELSLAIENEIPQSENLFLKTKKKLSMRIKIKEKIISKTLKIFPYINFKKIN